MKKISILLVLILLSLTFFGCATSKEVEFEILDVIFQTADGTWNRANLNEMTKFYYEKQSASVPTKISVKFLAFDNFHYGMIEGGVFLRNDLETIEFGDIFEDRDLKYHYPAKRGYNTVSYDKTFNYASNYPDFTKDFNSSVSVTLELRFRFEKS